MSSRNGGFGFQVNGGIDSDTSPRVELIVAGISIMVVCCSLVNGSVHLNAPFLFTYESCLYNCKAVM